MTSRGLPAVRGLRHASSRTRAPSAPATAGSAPGARSTVKVPAGVENGMRIRLHRPGRGRPRRRPGRRPLRRDPSSAPHPVFTRDGDDLHCTVTAADDGGGARHDARRSRPSTARRQVDDPARHPVRQGDPAARHGRAAAARHRPRRPARARRGRRRPTKLDAEQEELLRELAELRGEDRPVGSPRRPAGPVLPPARRVQRPVTASGLPRPESSPAVARRRAAGCCSTAPRAGTRPTCAGCGRRARRCSPTARRRRRRRAWWSRPARDGRSTVERRRAATPAPAPRLVVVQALPKGDRGELAVELLTEVGVDGSCPWAAARCVTQWRDERGDKALGTLAATAREAAQAVPPRLVARGRPTGDHAPGRRAAGRRRPGRRAARGGDRLRWRSTAMPARGRRRRRRRPRGRDHRRRAGGVRGRRRRRLPAGPHVLRTSTAGRCRALHRARERRPVVTCPSLVVLSSPSTDRPASWTPSRCAWWPASPVRSAAGARGRRSA